MRQLSLLQSAMDSYYKLRQLFYYKVRWIYYKLRQVLQSTMIITNCYSTSRFNFRREVVDTLDRELVQYHHVLSFKKAVDPKYCTEGIMAIKKGINHSKNKDVLQEIWMTFYESIANQGTQN